MNKRFYILTCLSTLMICSCGYNISDSGSTDVFSSVDSTSSEIHENDDKTDVSIPDDIQFPKQLWNTRYFFSKDANPNYCIIMDFGIPMNRFDSCVKVTEYPGYEHNFENYYYGTFVYEGEILHFTFTNAKDEETVKMTWDGKDIILDYCYSPDFEFELPAKGIKVEAKK